MRLTFLFLLFLLFYSCTDPSSQQSGEAGQPVADVTEPPPSVNVEDSVSSTGQSEKMAAQTPPQFFEKEFSAGKVHFRVVSKNEGPKSAKVTVSGLSATNPSREFDVEGQVVDAFLLDLNADGFSEVYLVLNAEGESGSHELKGFASYRDRSAGEIVVKDPHGPKKAGTDRVYAENGNLFRTFENENGKTVQLKYTLEKGETSFNLRPTEASE